MATTQKLLAQANSSSTTAYSLTTGLLTSFTDSAVVSTLTVTNVTALPVVYSIFIGKQGVITTTVDNSLVYRQTIGAYDIIPITIGLTLNYATAEDTIYVQSETANALTFMAFGSKIS